MGCEKCRNSRYTLKIEALGFPERIRKGYEREKSKMTLDFGWSNRFRGR